MASTKKEKGSSTLGKKIFFSLEKCAGLSLDCVAIAQGPKQRRRDQGNLFSFSHQVKRPQGSRALDLTKSALTGLSWSNYVSGTLDAEF